MAGVVGIDVGGTFTDLFYSHDGMSVDRVLKVPSTPDDPARGLIDALDPADIAPQASASSCTARRSRPTPSSSAKAYVAP